ncbi:MAG TPA: tetratricopeptide repeat protein, partial [Methanocorpusculum sp.]|nr:tetratricopeptide repeat protein [Methanocorpusculum sp.]
GKIMSEHFIGMERLLEVDKLVRLMDDPLEIVAELSCMDDERAKEKRRVDRRSTEKKEAVWIGDKKSAAKPSSEPAWVAKKKETQAEEKHTHDDERRKKAGTRKLRREEVEVEVPKAPRRANKEMEERVERKKREASQYIPPPKRKPRETNAGDEIKSRLGSSSQDPLNIIETAIDQRRAGNYDEALEILGNCVADNPKDSRALVELGKVYDLRGERDMAYACYQKAATANTQNREAIDRMNAFLIGITVDIDNETPDSKKDSAFVKKKKE